MAADANRCPSCGAERPANAPEGLCPACLMNAGLVHERDINDDATEAFHDAPTLSRGTGPGGSMTPLIDPPVESPRTGLETVRYFGDYELIEEVGRGGMGVVYQARQASLKRTVAVKMILEGRFAGEDDVRRFRLEAEAAANLDHPGIVPIFEIGEHEGRHYFSMGYVEGQNLANLVAAGPLPALEAAKLVRQLAEAVQYAHERGVIHRDLKPANVLLDVQGRPRVTDFGLAKMLKTDNSLTTPGQVMGTPSYMPPEQASGQAKGVGPEADVYALGAILYCLLTGRPPFQASNAVDTLLQVLEREPVLPRQLNGEVPRDIETIAMKCLQKDPKRRYSSAREFAEDLGRYTRGEPIQARPLGARERVAKWARRRPALATAVAVIMLVSTLGAAGVLWQWQQTRRALARARENLYVHLVNAADREWRANSVGSAEELLDECPAEYRGWEWHFLKRRDLSGWVTLTGRVSYGGYVGFVADGRLISACGREGDARLWNSLDGRATFGLAGDGQPTASVVFSPDGLKLAVCRDSRLEIRDVATGRKVQDVKVSADVDLRGFSRDGKTICGVNLPNQVVVMEATTGRTVRSWDLRDLKASLAIEPFATDGRILALLPSEEKTILLFDLERDYPPATLKGHPGWITSLTLSPDGRQLVSADTERTLIHWDMINRRAFKTVHMPDSVSEIALSPNGKTLAAAAGDRVMTLRDAATGRPLRTFRGHEDSITSLAFDPDGSRVASLDQAGVVNNWDVTHDAAARDVKTAGSDANVSSFRFSPDGQQVALVSGIAVRRDVCEIVVRILDVATSREVRSFRGYAEERYSDVAFSPDGKLMALSMGPTLNDRHVQIWDAMSGRELLALRDAGDMVTAVAFRPNGTRLATADQGGTLTIYDIPSGKRRFSIAAHEGYISDISYSPDGRLIASAGGGRGDVAVWDSETAGKVGTLDGHSKWVNALAFSPDGRLLATASQDRTVKVWDAAHGMSLLTLKGHKDNVSDVAFSPDGRRIASACSDGSVLLWDVTTGRALLSLNEAGHQVAFSPDGQILATLKDGGIVRLWDGSPSSYRSSARHRP